MTDPGAPQRVAVTTRQLAVATASAVAIAAVILLVAVLPAEYGIDPLRTGAALGLVRGPETPAAHAPPSPAGPVYRVDEAQFELAPYDYLEYKYRLAQSDAMVYSWEASAAVILDFHGAPDEGGSDAEVSLDKRTADRGAGSLTAAFPGMHGWYWENPGGTPITIRIRSAGFYGSAIEYRSNRTQLAHALGTPAGRAPSTVKER